MGEGLGPENLLRDVYNPKTLSGLADRLAGAWPPFDRQAFLREALPGLEGKSLGARTQLIRDALGKHLPSRYPEAVDILVRALSPPLDGKTPQLEDFIVLPLCGFVAKHGRDHFDLSMSALHEMTRRFSAEGDLRTFIEVDYERAMRTLEAWTRDPSPDVRRLVSEGTRPRLPMAPRIKRFQKDPRPVIALLDKLRSDPSEYVRRSVANNVNDIAKDHPDLAIATLARWNKDASPETLKLIRHAARTLVKQGNPAALALLGFSVAPRVTSSLSIAPRRARAGDAIRLTATLTSSSASPQSIVLDFAVYFRKANGTLAPKIFKWRTLTLAPTTSLSLEKKLPLRHTSGRTVYPGQHAVELRINGGVGARATFAIVASGAGPRGNDAAGTVRSRRAGARRGRRTREQAR